MTVSLDDELVGQARACSGLAEIHALLEEALRALVERDAGRQLASMGGSSPRLKAAPRRRI
ncbi:MAG TPA: type II toxin-antitoxin system VapB family antitoxin [Acidobacteriaceae bacterium]|nr:type II toxin-antitoxin system VapB family antitoxin [Acidobacteriaceae bacterium]